MHVAYVNLIATGIIFNIWASSSHIGQMMAFSEHRRWIISVFDRRSIMNRLYWHNQQVGYLCFIPFVWEQRGVIAAVADQTAMISQLLPMCWATRGWSWGNVGAVWEPSREPTIREKSGKSWKMWKKSPWYGKIMEFHFLGKIMEKSWKFEFRKRKFVSIRTSMPVLPYRPWLN